jgi:hypothetical protein
MAARGLPVSPVGVARAYAPWLDVLLVDPGDREVAGELTEAGVSAVAADILMTDRASEQALARQALDAASRGRRR